MDHAQGKEKGGFRAGKRHAMETGNGKHPGQGTVFSDIRNNCYLTRIFPEYNGQKWKYVE